MITHAFLTVLLATVVLDFTWSFSITAINGLQPLRAGLWTALLTSLQVFIITEYVANKEARIATVIGAFLGVTLGTYVQLRRKKS